MCSTPLFHPLFTRGNVFICEGRVGGEQRERWSKRNKIASERKEWDFGHLWVWSDAKPLPTEPMHMPNCLFLQQSPALLPPTTGWKRNPEQSTGGTKPNVFSDHFILVSFSSYTVLCGKCGSISQYPVLVKFIAKQEQWSTPPTCKTEMISYVMKQKPVEREAQEFMKDV